MMIHVLTACSTSQVYFVTVRVLASTTASYLWCVNHMSCMLQSWSNRLSIITLLLHKVPQCTQTQLQLMNYLDYYY